MDTGVGREEQVGMKRGVGRSKSEAGREEKEGTEVGVGREGEVEMEGRMGSRAGGRDGKGSGEGRRDRVCRKIEEWGRGRD